MLFLLLLDYQSIQIFRGCSAKKVVKIPGVGLDNEAVHNRFIPKEEKRRELGIPKDAFVILSVGNLYHVKNQDVIIKAVAKIHDKGIYYLIAGEGEKKEEYQKMIHGYGMEDRIRLIGFRDDISELCYASDVFAHP